jgi:hypothetical protein
MRSFNRFFWLAVAAAALVAQPARADDGPDVRDTFHIIPLWNAMARADTPEEAIHTEMKRLVEQCGRGNRYHRVGFSFIYPAGKPEVLRRDCRIAREHGLVLGLVVGMQTHGNAAFARKFLGDLRNYQWRSDGKNWKDLPRPDKPLDWHENLASLCPSRYCDPVRTAVEEEGRRQAREILAVMREYPGIIAVINPLIEQGLGAGQAVGGGQAADGTLYYCDAGPYTTTEFRDWLLHRGRYDADGGVYAGEGAPKAITGPWLKIASVSRSAFYDDPDPTNANDTGPSFNRYFGTTFTSWKLRHYDLENCPSAITDPSFDSLAEEGPTFVDGGFQIPAFDPRSRFWRAWTWVNQDQGGRYPPGNPRVPSFGFGQVVNQHYVNDFVGFLIEEGLPADRIYAHQVPTEALGESPKALVQARTLGMSAWTGYLPACRTVGITRFGPIDPAIMTQYAPHWGIFEWHPQPGAPPDSQRLYDAARRDLERYAKSGCRFVFPGWWHPAGKPKEDTATFPLPDSRFTEAIRDFLATRKEVPLR